MVMFGVVTAHRAGLAKGLDQLVRKEQAQLGFGLVPGHGHPFGMVDKVVEVEFKAAVTADAHNLAHLVQIDRLAIGRQAHNLALVAIFGEAEPLGDRGVEDAERVGEVDFVAHFQLVALAHAPHGADKVAHAIDREDGGFGKGRDEKGAGHVGAVVFDIVKVGLEVGGLNAQLLTKDTLEIAHLDRVLQAVGDKLERGAALKGKKRLLHQVGAGVAADANVGQLLRANSCFGQDKTDRLHRKASLVFDAAKALFFNGGDQLAVANQTGGRAAVVGVDAQNVHE